MIFDDDAPETSEETPEEVAEDATEETVEDATDEEETSDEEASDDEASDEETSDEETSDEEASDDEASDEESGDAEDGAELTLGEASSEDEEPRTPRQPALIRGKIDRHGVAIGTGRRKTAVARVRITDGDGGMTINGRALDNYFQIERDRLLIEAPLRATEMLGSVNVWVRVNGGGPTGQAGAIVLGIARALQAKNPNLHEALSDGGYLTRDGRMVERKKYGYKKARKSFQFSKR
ncbi:MAG: 30S ribosomal protein S9 [Planctomycetota bacterium]|nr:30S ribosomal protein S9 [Planctomycetota bacterium]